MRSTGTMCDVVTSGAERVAHSLPSVITYSWTHIAVSLLPEAARHWRVVSLNVVGHGLRGACGGLAGVGGHARSRRLLEVPRRLLRAGTRARRRDARGRLRRGPRGPRPGGARPSRDRPRPL